MSKSHMNSSHEIISPDYNNAHEYNYYDIFNVQFSRAADPQFFDNGFTTTFLRIIFVLISRIGFILIQLGSIPVENVYRIIFYNFFEIANVILSYILIGFVFSFGRLSLKGWIGYSSSFSNSLDEAGVGISACLIGTAQISSFLVGRIHLMASIITTFLYCAFYEPLLLHWIWNENGWMNKWVLLGKRVSLKDHAGDLVVHLSSSIIGLIGALFLGRRLIKLKDIDEHSLGREHSGNTIVGYVFIIFGYIAFSLPTPSYLSLRVPFNYTGMIVINNIVALAVGILIISVLHLLIFRKIFSYWIILRCIQGGIAGIISVAAGVDIFSPFECLAIAAVSSFFFFFFSILIHNTALEDYCNLTASHLVCSFLGILACPLLAHKENFGVSARKFHILWQFICVIIVISITITFAWLLFLFFSLTKILRSKREAMNHQRAVVVQKYLPKRGFMERLFMIDSQTQHIAPGDKNRQSFLEHDVLKKEVQPKIEQKKENIRNFERTTFRNVVIDPIKNFPLEPKIDNFGNQNEDISIKQNQYNIKRSYKIPLGTLKENLIQDVSSPSN
ncbi:ammonium transporter 2 [Leptinotarsa decemlineata]|uniref:ammonium transporter 2 n=1 Tax=Leptinotarsa decemlineata TaxID=7539 RepID=UPI000C255146|nr:ammonium transporter 2-like [Leptinotarsa decemlineata]